MSQPRACERRAAAAGGAPPSPRCPATFWTWRTLTLEATVDDPVGPVLDRMALLDARAQARGRARSGPGACEACAASSARSRGVVALEARAPAAARRRSRCWSQHRHAGRGRLVDDLVECALAHVVDEDVALGEQGRHLRVAASRAAQRDAEREQTAPARPRSSAVSDGPYTSSSTLGELAGPRDRLESLRGRRPPERDGPQPRRRLARLTQENAVDVDPVADRDHLRRGERERAAVDADDGGREPLGEDERATCAFQWVNQSRSGTPPRPTSGAARIA